MRYLLIDYTGAKTEVDLPGELALVFEKDDLDWRKKFPSALDEEAADKRREEDGRRLRAEAFEDEHYW